MIQTGQYILEPIVNKDEDIVKEVVEKVEEEVKPKGLMAR